MMITARDFDFHPCDPNDKSWTETLFLIFSVPEAGISGNLYTLARPNLGICHSSIEIHTGMSLHPWQIDHNDAQMHLPCPSRFDDLTLDNGLTFKALNAREFTFQYQSLDGNCSLDVVFKAVCDPFDPHDAAENPLTGSANMVGYDGWNTGHMESKGRATGRISMHGREYRINCIDGMNKSWGPRMDWGSQGGTWVQANLGDDLGAFFALGLNFENKEVVTAQLRSIIAELSAAAQGADHEAALDELIMERSRQILLNERLWCSPLGFELRPQDLPVPLWMSG